MTKDEQINLVLSTRAEHKPATKRDTVMVYMHPADRLLLQDIKKQYGTLIGMPVTYGDTIAWLYHLAQEFFNKQKQEKDKELC